MKVSEGKNMKIKNMKRLLSFRSPKAFVYVMKPNHTLHLGNSWTDEAIL